MSSKVNLPYLLSVSGLTAVALAVFLFIFNPTPDFNGDNCYYYANATSLASGNGYADMFGEPVNNFPPGYPLLMAPLRMITGSIVAQKVMNLVFMFVGVLLLFSTLIRSGFKYSLAFLACVAVLITPHLLEFSTMMMSEASCFCCLSLIFWLYQRVPYDKSAVWRSRRFYMFLAALVFVCYIRTQAVAVIVAFVFAMLLMRRWKVALAVIGAFFIGYLPWMIRNEIHGLNQSRYVSQIDFSKVLETLKMLIFQAIPESVIPFVEVDYRSTPTVMLCIFAVLWFAFVLYGFWKMEKLRLPMIIFLFANLAIISSIDTPSNYRYLIIILPFITAAVFVGLWHLSASLTKRMLNKQCSPWFLAVLFIPMFMQCDNISKHTIWGLHFFANMELPKNIDNFFEAGRALYRTDRHAIVASRKPELLYLASGMRGKHFMETNDEYEFIKDLLAKKVDYVIIEQLGFPATQLYLIPCVNHHPELFRLSRRVPEPDTFVIYFDKLKAYKWLKEQNKRGAD